MADSSRVRWLDGLRGLAAIQVVLLHFATAFLPGIGQLDRSNLHYAWEAWFIGTPLFFPLDGYSAVYVFFLLSGAALTWSFGAHPAAVLPNFVRRTVRLGGPMVGAVLFGAGLLALMPDLHGLAGARSNSVTWLSAVSPDHVTPGMVARQIGVEGMLTGYRETTLLPHRLPETLGLASLVQSLNAPLWTLHVEFAGSVLLLLLVWLRAALGRLAHGLVCAALCAAFATSPIVLFVLGHLVAPLLLRAPDRPRPWISLLGLASLTAGVLLCCTKDWEPLGRLLATLPPSPLGARTHLLHFTSMVGAVLVFAGVVLLVRLHGLLERRPLLWVGKISFSLYLVHFPILFTVACAVFLATVDLLPYGVSVLAASLVGIALSLFVAIGYERWVDAPTIRASRRLARRFAGAGLKDGTSAAIAADR